MVVERSNLHMFLALPLYFSRKVILAWPSLSENPPEKINAKTLLQAATFGCLNIIEKVIHKHKKVCLRMCKSTLQQIKRKFKSRA